VLLVVGQVAIRRDYRHPYLLCLSEAGHLLQNLQLVATALDLASCELGSIEEDALFAFMGTKDYQEVPMGAIAIGSLP
jgi:nitroreductase